MTTSPLYIGIDVSKATLDLGTTTAKQLTVSNDAMGHRKLIDWLLAQPAIALVVLEATGIYGHTFMAALVAANLPLAVAQPGRVRNFARCEGTLAKTDSIDACVIARFGEAIKPRLYQPLSEAAVHLRALVDRRDQIIDLRVCETNHLEACRDNVIAKDLRANIRRLKNQEATYTRLIANAIESDEHLRQRSELIQQEPGVGPQTAAVLLAYVPELGHLNRQEIAAVCGLAPINHDSGNQHGRRSVAGGRPRVREALYMAGVSAARHHDHLSAWYQTLIAKGKPAKIAIIACARKLIIRLNTAVAALDRTALTTGATTAETA